MRTAAVETESGTPAESRPFAIGLVCADPLRVVGFLAILERIVLAVPGRGTLVPTTHVLAGARLLRSHLPDLVLVDAAGVPFLFELLASFQRFDPGLHMLVVGLEASTTYTERVIGAGARGYLTHNASEQELRLALEVVADGSVWAPRKVLARLLDLERTRYLTSLAAHLTPREGEVLRELACGRSNREVGASLHIDEATVKAHVGRLMRKLSVGNRTALLVRARELGLLALPGLQT